MSSTKIASVVKGRPAPLSRSRMWFVLLDEEVGIVMADVMGSIMKEPLLAVPALRWLDREGLTTKIVDSDSEAAMWGVELEGEM